MNAPGSMMCRNIELDIVFKRILRVAAFYVLETKCHEINIIIYNLWQILYQAIYVTCYITTLKLVLFCHTNERIFWYSLE